ncbi:MAG: SGNH/GDSL hydrolase family protein [Azospirillaceae bacterium]
MTRAKADPRTLLCFGDSNTHGTMPMDHRDDRRRLGPAERWPGVCAARLGRGWRVVEEGLPGRTTVHADPIEGAHKNGLAALPMALESHLPIDTVVLMLGTNDLKARFSLPPEDIARGCERLAEAIRASDAGPDGAAPALVVVAPPPIEEAGWLAPMFEGGRAKSREFGPLYEALAARHGARFLDAGTIIASSPVDGIHFDADMHAKLGEAVAAIVGAS